MTVPCFFKSGWSGRLQASANIWCSSARPGMKKDNYEQLLTQMGYFTDAML
jgi:hypothetical protein